MRDVEAALKGYLWNRGNNAEAWMYRALAMAIQMNQGSPADVKIVAELRGRSRPEVAQPQ